MAVRRMNYSHEEKAAIKRLFEEGCTDNQIAVSLGRTVAAIIQQRGQLGLTRQASSFARLWTEEEKAIVKEGYANHKPPSEIAALLQDRTPLQVRSYAYVALGLRVLKNRFTPEEDDFIRRKYAAFTPIDDIARDINRDPGTLRQRIKYLGLSRDRRRVILLNRFAVDAQDARPTEELWASRNAKQEAEKAARSASIQAEVEKALDDMMQTLGEGGYRKPAFQKAMVAGATLKEIGDRVGVSRERVRQIVHGVKTNTTLVGLAKRLILLNQLDYESVLDVVTKARTKPVDNSPV